MRGTRRGRPRADRSSGMSVVSAWRMPRARERSAAPRAVCRLAEERDEVAALLLEPEGLVERAGARARRRRSALRGTRRRLSSPASGATPYENIFFALSEDALAPRPARRSARRTFGGVPSPPRTASPGRATPTRTTRSPRPDAAEPADALARAAGPRRRPPSRRRSRPSPARRRASATETSPPENERRERKVEANDHVVALALEDLVVGDGQHDVEIAGRRRRWARRRPRPSSRSREPDLDAGRDPDRQLLLGAAATLAASTSGRADR